MQILADPARPILVVDDHAKIVRLVKTYLELDGFRVVTAADGPAALEAIEWHRRVLGVLDLMLPELDGRAVIRAVRSDEEGSRRSRTHDANAFAGRDEVHNMTIEGVWLADKSADYAIAETVWRGNSSNPSVEPRRLIAPTMAERLGP